MENHALKQQTMTLTVVLLSFTHLEILEAATSLCVSKLSFRVSKHL